MAWCCWRTLPRIAFLRMSAPLISGRMRSRGRERRIAQAGEVAVFQIQEMTGQGREICGVDEEATDDQDGLLVRQGWIAQCAEITGFVDEADVQRHPRKSYGHQMVAIGSAAPAGSAIGVSEFSIGAVHLQIKGREGRLPVPLGCRAMRRGEHGRGRSLWAEVDNMVTIRSGIAPGCSRSATADMGGGRRTAASSAASRRGRDPVSIIPDHSGVSR